MKVTTWQGLYHQNRPYNIWARSRIIRLIGYNHNRATLKNILSTMEANPQHLFMFSSSDVYDLDVRLDNVIPMLHVSNGYEYRHKIKHYLDLDPEIIAISIFAGSPVEVYPNTNLIMLSGNKFESTVRTAKHARHHRVSVYTEYFQGNRINLPSELNFRELPIQIQDKLTICSWS